MPLAASTRTTESIPPHSGLPLTAHQQIAKYELPLPRPSALVQPGRPPVEDNDRPKRPLLEANMRPILSALTDSLCKCALQPWQGSHSDSTPIWRQTCVEILKNASCSPSASIETGVPMLALELSPLEIRHVDDQRLVVQRSPYHRPTPSAYRTAWSVAYLHLINHVIHHNNNAAGGQQLHPAERLRNFFPPLVPEEGLTPDARLLQACHRIFPRGIDTSMSMFCPRRAVVFSIDTRQAAEDQARPRFHCIAGWARWSALLATLEGIRLKGQSVSATHQKALETRVPVYVIDSSNLTPSMVAALSLGLNLMDADVAAGVDPLRHFIENDQLTDIRSRPPTICDRLWTLHQITVEVDSLPEEEIQSMSTMAAPQPRMDEDASSNESSDGRFSEPEPRSLAGVIYDRINSHGAWLEFGNWLDSEARKLQESPWATHPLVVPNYRRGMTLGRYAETILAFMLSLAWPLSYMRVDDITLPEMRALLGADFPFGPLDLHGRSRSGVGLWDAIFLHHLPYQIQCIFSMADLMGFVRQIEVFFVPRSRTHAARLRKLNWLAADQVSLLVHFARSDSASTFACRILANDNLRNMAAQVQPIAFESLSAFICTYNLQHCLELEEAWLKAGDTPAGNDPASSLREIPAASNDIYGVGASRVLHTVRAIAVMAYLTCDNPAQLQELARLQQPETRQAPLPLPVPHPAKPNLSAFALLPTLPQEARSRLENDFELLIGMIAELVFRELLAGLGKDESFNLLPDNTSSALHSLQQRAIRQEGLPPKSWYLLETLNAGALLLQVFLRECMTGGSKTFRTVALFPGSAGGSEVDGVSLSQLVRVPLTDILSARLKTYELVTKHLAQMKLDCHSLSHHHFLWRVLEPLQRSAVAEAGRQAERILMGEAALQILNPPRSSSLPNPPIMALSAPTIEPREDENTAGGVIPEVLKSRGLTQSEYFNIICQRRFQAAHMMATETRLDADLRKLIGKDDKQSPQKSGIDTQERITRWFEDRKADSRRLLSHLYRLSQSDASITIKEDFRKMTAEEARNAAGPLTDLAADSTHVTASLQDIPYQLQVEDPTILPFAEAALKAIRKEIEETLRTHLTDGLKQLMLVNEAGHSVVCSARPAVICALWQTLVRLSPFLDILHPLAVRWNELRAAFCAWLWQGLRRKLDQYWQSICKEQLVRSDNLPHLRWSMRCLPGDSGDGGALTHLPDLTAERLHSLLLGPRMLDRICSAYYRFQCSGMANARAALGSVIDAPAITADRLTRIFTSTEPSLRDLFSDLWTRVRPETPVEDALHDPEIASAGFLKRYAPYVLNGLDELDRSADIVDFGEPSTKRRKREGEEDLAYADRVTSRRRQVPSRLNEVSAGMILGNMAVQELRKDLKNRSVRRGGPRPMELTDEDEVVAEMNVEDSDWLRSLPLSLRHRLDRPLPSDEIFENFERIYEELRHTFKNPETTVSTTPSPLPTEVPPSQPVGRRRRHGRFVTNDFRTVPQMPEADATINGSFPVVPPFLESSPAWTLWKPPYKRPEGLMSPWAAVRDADYSAETEQRYLLSTCFTRREAESVGEISDRDWALIQTVLEFLCRRGVDTLYSSRTESVFKMSMTDGATSRVKNGQEWQRELEEVSEMPGRQPATFQGRLLGNRHLRRYLNGWSSLEQCVNPLSPPAVIVPNRLKRRRVVPPNVLTDSLMSDEAQDVHALDQHIVIV